MVLASLIDPVPAFHGALLDSHLRPLVHLSDRSGRGPADSFLYAAGFLKRDHETGKPLNRFAYTYAIGINCRVSPCKVSPNS